MSVHYWIKPDHVGTCTALGFTVKKGRGKDRHFIESRDNPLDPSADTYRIPSDAISEITVRMTSGEHIPSGLYVLPCSSDSSARMLVTPKYTSQRVQRGFFQVMEDRPSSDGSCYVRIRARSRELLLQIFQGAYARQFEPVSGLSEDLIREFDTGIRSSRAA